MLISLFGLHESEENPSSDPVGECMLADLAYPAAHRKADPSSATSSSRLVTFVAPGRAPELTVKAPRVLSAVSDRCAKATEKLLRMVNACHRIARRNGLGVVISGKPSICSR